jgi:hypothetical protein
VMLCTNKGWSGRCVCARAYTFRSVLLVLLSVVYSSVSVVEVIIYMAQCRY